MGEMKEEEISKRVSIKEEGEQEEGVGYRKRGPYCKLFQFQE